MGIFGSIPGNLAPIQYNDPSANFLDEMVEHGNLTQADQVKEYLGYYGNGDINEGYDVILKKMGTLSVGVTYLLRDEIMGNPEYTEIIEAAEEFKNYLTEGME